MKRLLLFIFYFPILLFAQSFAPIGAKWTYQIGSGCCNNGNEWDYVEWQVFKDTLIKQQNCKMLLKKGISIEGFADTMFVYQNQEQIYFYDFYSENFTLLYDFFKKANESWKVKSGNCELNVMVESVSSININGQNLKQLHVISNNSDFEGVIIEKIGFLKKPQPDFAQYCFGLVSYLNYYDGLRCYEDPEIGFYDFQIAPSCDFVKVNKDKPKELILNVFPNPSRGVFNINSNTPLKNTELNIFNSNGQLVASLYIQDKKSVKVSLENLPNGIYLLQIKTHQNYQFLKLILDSF